MSVIAYCLTLTTATVMHGQIYPGIWSMSVYAVPWFVQYGTAPVELIRPASQAKEPLPDSSSSRESQDLSKSNVDVEAVLPKVGSPSNINLDLISAPWAMNRGRRGVDPPFATKEQAQTVPEARLRVPRATRYFELSWFVRKSQAPPAVGPKTPGGFFSRSAGDEDEPIQLPRLSEWIRADAEKGINVHTIPPVSP
jgi:hypothetical protein